MVLSVEFAPLFMPLSRRLQTMSVFCMSLFFAMGPLLGTISFIILMFSPLSLLAVIYITYYFLWDFDVSARGGRRFSLLRRLPVWNYFCQYFPIKLVKTAELPADRNYIFGYHPHGVISSGAFSSFATEGAGFSKLFPGIVPHLMTLKFNFRWPFHRDFLLGLGLNDVSKESINHVCTNQGTGNAAIIVIGGAAESLEAYPGSAKLKLKGRKGFVKLALKNGADLVPVYGFGENDLLCQAQHPWLRRLQEMIRSISGIAPVMFYGRGIFQYSFGLMPFRVPVNLVVGEPIPVTKSTEITQEMIDDLHTKYIDALTALYDQHKKKYSNHPDVELSFM
eukprot:TCONS_00022436-protein